MPPRFSVRELQLILEALSTQYGRGYSDVPEVGRLQAKLSMLLEIAVRLEADDASSR